MKTWLQPLSISPLNNYTPRRPIDCFSGLLRFTKKLRRGRNCPYFIGPWCQVGGSEWHLWLKNIFLFPCSRFKCVFPAKGKDLILWGLRIKFCVRSQSHGLWELGTGTFRITVSGILVLCGSGTRQGMTKGLGSWFSCFHPPLLHFYILDLSIAF